MNDKQAIRKALNDFDFRNLFREYLGWEPLSADLPIDVAGRTISFTGVAEKRGFAVLQCTLPDIPPHAERRKIEHRVAKSHFEHLIIFVDEAHTKQVWQWVRREPNKPVQCREQRFEKGQSGELLLQKIEALKISLEDEEGISLIKVKGRMGVAFQAEKVTKRFFDRFQKEHDRFQGFISGISAQVDLNWYTSITLNRLMFVYFIQKKGFLDSDTKYLGNRLAVVKFERGQNEFHTFYRYFLLRLFHEGLGGQNHSPELEKLLGKVPYLNGGLFEVHALEKKYPELDIPDQAFEGIFDFFDAYDWHLDERPLRKDNEINPDVLGYIFEKYINQKQMGAYYTKEDITEYISKNTIVPYLFDQARKQCAIAFENPTGNTVWHLLQDNPDKYLYDAMRTGVIDRDGNIIPESQLPEYVQEGMHDPKKRMFDKRYNLQQAVVMIYSKKDECEKNGCLPTETWREYVNRRNRCLELRSKLQSGEITSINDLITYNLNIRQFAQDVLESWEGSDLIKAFWNAISEVTVLDPTCGSGAFLFAALNILEPLYEACLQRMETFTAETPDPKKHDDFRKILENVNKHPNRQYFIYKSIILNNLYGVDIMDEAVEICKLRLFLKLAAQVEPDGSKNNYGLEPLPDIDFNIRAGNTLVGYATEDSLKRLIEADIRNVMDGTWDSIQKRAKDVQQAFDLFRRAQTEGDGHVPIEDKQKLRNSLFELEEELNHYLAKEYGKDSAKQNEYQAWLASHKPFHWFIDFYGILQKGGFDVIIGNPPYVEYRKVRDTYRLPEDQYMSESAANLYAFCMERSSQLLKPVSNFGMIVPAGVLGLDESESLRNVLLEQYSNIWCSTYAIRPSKLFDGVDQRLCIYLGMRQMNGKLIVQTTRYHHWSTDERPALFPRIEYTNSGVHNRIKRIAQVGNPTAACILEKLERKCTRTAIHYYAHSGRGLLMHYHRSPRYWIRAMDFEQHFKSPTRSRSVHHFRDIYFDDSKYGKFIGALLNSTLFFFWFISVGNGRNITGTDVEQVPVGEVDNDLLEKASNAFNGLMRDYNKNSFVRTREDCEFQEFRVSESKPIIDQIDQVLAEHYGFTDEELDFIINYDIKYRMGASEEGEE
jgi:hypothetical protein